MAALGPCRRARARRGGNDRRLPRALAAQRGVEPRLRGPARPRRLHRRDGGARRRGGRGRPAPARPRRQGRGRRGRAPARHGPRRRAPARGRRRRRPGRHGRRHRVAPGWLAAQLEAAAGGAGAIGGEIVLAGPRGRPRARGARARSAPDGGARPGPSTSTSAARRCGDRGRLRRVGGIEPLAALEDEALRAGLAAPGSPSRGPPARGSAPGAAGGPRLPRSRARPGARALAERRATRPCTRPAGSRAKRAHRLRRRSRPGVRGDDRRRSSTCSCRFRGAGAVDEVLVVDAALRRRDRGPRRARPAPTSCRRTPPARLRALPREGRRDVARAGGDHRGDRRLPRRGHRATSPRALLRPARRRSSRDPSSRSSRAPSSAPSPPAASSSPGEGGRVTELMARPLLNLHRPELAGFAQPLAGEVAARRELLERLAFPVGYGVEIAMLLDALRAGRARRAGPGRPRHAPEPPPAAARALGAWRTRCSSPPRAPARRGRRRARPGPVRTCRAAR